MSEHPLVQKKISYLCDWSDWLKKWKETEEIELLIGLLHVGWDTAGSLMEKVLFYLALADNADSGTCYFTSENDPTYRCSYRTGVGEFASYSEMRIAIAVKAFEVLCQRFFKEYLPEDGRRLFRWPVAEKEEYQIVKALSHFLRCDETGKMVNGNCWCLKEHSRTVFQNFIRLFCLYVANCVYSEDKRGFGEPWPNCLKILDDCFGHNGLRFLLDRDVKWWKHEATMATLKEMALDRKLYFGSEVRKPKSIQEAAYLGSAVARILLILQIMREEDVRLEELRQLEARQRRDEKRLKELSSGGISG